MHSTHQSYSTAYISTEQGVTMNNEIVDFLTPEIFWSVSLEHFIKHQPPISELYCNIQVLCRLILIFFLAFEVQRTKYFLVWR